MVGKVKWFNANRGYGFIDYGQGVDAFVHYSEINAKGYRSLEEGEEVEFEIEYTERGIQARNVARIDS